MHTSCNAPVASLSIGAFEQRLKDKGATFVFFARAGQAKSFGFSMADQGLDLANS